MPVWDGWNFLKEFRKLKIGSEPIIYILTSSMSQSDKEKANYFGLDGHYLIKPIDLKQIKEIFENQVEGEN